MTPRKKTRFASDPADVLDVQVYALPELETLKHTLPTLLEAWPAVRANFSTLHSSDVAQQEAVLTLRVDLGHDVDAMESKICRLVTLNRLSDCFV
jgi:hypothetical protein